ncbi:uncharacterized protein KIAA1211-like isoform X1 [Scleropages formosus]|uniref:uncharacterized protein KIAA1211-like isoform X1 n=1 Tax=Scleropages formosus TaxID=113540 RepID=UPI0010FAC516|nr:uncharacterized protein KIAA1211-like isoform X1 [Scleropages formosus]
MNGRDRAALPLLLDCNIMASGLPDVTANQEPGDSAGDCPGKKKSKFQTFKNFFVRKKRKEAGAPAAESSLKASQSTDNVAAPEPSTARSDTGGGSGCKVTMGNKAMSHDSVFVADTPSSDANEGLASSQDSIHGKVKSLQLQLKQAIKLGTPPALICRKKGEDAGALSEDDGLPCSPPEISTLHTVLAGPSHAHSNPVQRTSSLSLEGFDSDDDQMSFEASSRPMSPPRYPPADFSRPATPSACLDSSAARHRIAVKHRACAKRKPASKQLLESSKLRAAGKEVPPEFRDRHDTDGAESSSEKEKPEGSLADEVIQQMDADVEETEGEEVTPEDGPSVAVSSEDKPAGSDQYSDEPEDRRAPEATSCSSSCSSSVADSEEFLPALSSVPQRSLRTPSPEAISQESLASSEPATGQDTECELEFECEPTVEESGSLLLEVLSSLERPLTTEFGLQPDTEVLENTKTDGMAAEQFEKPAPSSPVSEHHLVVEVGSDTSCVAVEEESDVEEKLSEEEECMQLVEAVEADEGAESLVIVEQSLPSEGEEEEETKEDEDEVIVDSASETQEHKDSEMFELVSEADLADDGIMQGGDDLEFEAGNASDLEAVADLTIGGLEDDTQPSVEGLTTEDHEEPEEPNQGILSQMSTPGVSPEQGLENTNAQEDCEESSSSPEQSRVRFTIVPAWQRSLSGGSFKEPTFMQPIAPEAFEPCPGELESPADKEEPQGPTKADSTASPGQSQRPASPPPARDPTQQEEDRAETPFGVRLRKTSLRSLRYGSEDSGEAPGSPGPVEPTEAPRALPGTKPVLPKKPELPDDGAAKLKRTSDVTHAEPLGGNSAAPSWISVAKQKQKIYKENSLEEIPVRKGTCEKDSPFRKSSLPVLVRSTNKNSGPPTTAGLPPAVPCSQEISKATPPDKDVKRTMTTPSPAALGQEEPPWLALAKKKAKAWSEMPQIVQ